MRIDRQRAKELGFPEHPAPGQIVIDRSGMVWRWPRTESGYGLGDLDDLGQWESLVGLGVGLFGKLFGSSKEDQQKKAAIQQLTAQNAQLQVAIAQEQASPFHMSKMWLALIAVGVVAFVAMKR